MIRYSIETLWHFSCEACGKWWSIGDHQISGARVHGETLTCPHCGTKAEIAPAEPLETTAPVQAKVDADGWIEWKGGKCPIPKHTWVQIKTLGGACGKAHAGFYRWNHADHPEDIVAYRVIGD